MLNNKQKQTIENLKIHQDITDPKEVVFYCMSQIDKKSKGSKRRRHSKKHYREIINYLAQGNYAHKRARTAMGEEAIGTLVN